MIDWVGRRALLQKSPIILRSLLIELSRDIFETFSSRRCDENVLRVSRNDYATVLRMSRNDYSTVSKMSRECHEMTIKMSRECHEMTIKMSHEMTIALSRKSLELSRHILVTKM